MADRKLPKGIKALASGRFQVREQLDRGSNRMVSATFDTFDEAVAAQHRARAARAEGGDIRSALGVVAKREKPTPESGSRTVRQMHAQYIAEREAICKTGGHDRRRSAKRNQNSLRPRTLENDQRQGSYLEPLMEIPIDELDRRRVLVWLYWLAGRGPDGDPLPEPRFSLTTAVARKALDHLRSLVVLADETGRTARPWQKLQPVEPATPGRPKQDPSKWGGPPGSKPPAVTVEVLLSITSARPAADRLADYLEIFAGVRIGEIFGLRLGDLEVDAAGILWINIRRQRDDTSGDVIDWTKSDAGYRRIPLPGLLTEFIERYVHFYHQEYDLRSPNPTASERFLVVNGAGRDLDGSFLPANPSAWWSRMTKAQHRLGLDVETLGYSITSHFYRKTCSTILLNAEAILTADCETEEPLPPLGFSGIHISKYLGHEHSGTGDLHGASSVTLTHYNLALPSDDALLAIARAHDRIARKQVRELPFKPDDSDMMPVFMLHDPEWMTVIDAAKLIGIHVSNVTANINKGKLEGKLGWQADGGYKRNRNQDTVLPAMAKYFVRRDSAERLRDARSMRSMKRVGQELGMYAKTVETQFAERGLMSITNGRVTDEDFERIRQLLLDATYDALRASRLPRSSPDELKKPFDRSRSNPLDPPFAKVAWLTTWLDMLVDAGRARRHADGRYVPVEPAPES